MLERIESPDTVLAIRAVGKVEKDDYRSVLEPAVAALLADQGEIRLVYVIGDEFDGYSFGADWEDTKFGFSHLAHWKRCAIVTDRDWIRHGVGMFHWMMPGELRVFDRADVDAAITWAAG
jgi:GNAT superfamily N-acetyltransferase